MGLLDKFLNDGTPFSVEAGATNDLVTQYNSPWLSGTPNPTANPGPITPFTQDFTPANQYANNISLANSQLAGILPITNLDVENPGVAGGPNDDITTVYPPNITGTPTNTQNPGGPITRFTQTYSPNYPYVFTIGNGRLENTLDITNLDIENPGVNGGPNADIITSYSPLVTGTPTLNANPGGPVTNFSQPNTPSNTYLNNNTIAGIASGKLDKTLPITNLDVEAPGVDGGIPYKTYKDPTSYPITTNASSPIRGHFATPGKGSSKYGTIDPNNIYKAYSPADTYLSFIEPFI